jgi:N-acyl-D-aspartate/D-glutamate deacylase
LKNLEIFYRTRYDNESMAKKQAPAVSKHVRFPPWMEKTIQKIADEKQTTFTDVVLDLLRQELAVMGYTMGIGREGLTGGEADDTN